VSQHTHAGPSIKGKAEHMLIKGIVYNNRILLPACAYAGLSAFSCLVGFVWPD
jgi:hypothetical protein